MKMLTLRSLKTQLYQTIYFFKIAILFRPLRKDTFESSTTRQSSEHRTKAKFHFFQLEINRGDGQTDR